MRGSALLMWVACVTRGFALRVHSIPTTFAASTSRSPAATAMLDPSILREVAVYDMEMEARLQAAELAAGLPAGGSKQIAELQSKISALEEQCRRLQSQPAAAKALPVPEPMPVSSEALVISDSVRAQTSECFRAAEAIVERAKSKPSPRKLDRLDLTQNLQPASAAILKRFGQQ